MKRSLKLLTIHTVIIKMHWTFIILPVWIIAANAVMGFTWVNITWSLVFLVLVFLSVAIQEFVHYRTARRLHIQINEITLIPTGGISYYENYPKNIWEELLVNLSGPLANLAIAGLLLPFIQGHQPIWNVAANFDIIHEEDILYKLHLVNLGLFALNLLPAFPFNGGNLLRALLGIKMDYFRATGIVIIIGKVLASVALLTGILYFNLLLLVISVLIFGALEMESYVLHLRFLVKELIFREVVVNDFQNLQAGSKVKDVMSILMSDHAKHFFLMEAGRPIGTVERMHILNEAAEKNYDLPVKSLMKENLVYFNANDMVKSGFKTLLTYPYKNYPVMDGKKFIGAVNLMYVLEYLLLHNIMPKEHKKLKALINKIS